ncbi:MAG: Respiratory supercomplex factor 1, mitochondrial [Sclerophora amabilis]|nr:MAG: Respiratory supercomplex factor 1, mitochondrial [Sclerophora amabilis]
MSDAPLPSSFDGNKDFYEENRWQKFSRRLKEEPLVPLGCVLTCYALFQAGKSIRIGDHARTNRMFRARIYAQGFTLLAIVAGSVYYQKDREKRKQFDGIVAEKKVQEKRDAWIRELEVREQEDNDIKARRNAMRIASLKEREALETGEERGQGIVDAVKELKDNSR